MPFRNPWVRLRGYYQRRSASLLFTRPFAIASPEPLISFTFDDFPASALHSGGSILSEFGAAGTYYVSLGLADQDAPTGRMFSRADLRAVVEGGHELGCHTFSHCDSWDTAPEEFERAVIENREALGRALPGVTFQSLSYPISPPRPATKVRMARHFRGCRGGGQVPNIGTADLNHLSAFFLEKSRDDLQTIRAVIDRNRRERGWLIFATHDVCERPTRFGCTPAVFEAVVRYSCENGGGTVLPVAAALDRLGVPGSRP
jgi:peptidoglycan/xylan/chitin deacetylase (PgdA/CDA1 family)